MPGFFRSRVRGGYGAQELHGLITAFVHGFVLYPVAHIVEFETPHETSKAGAESVRGRIQLHRAIRLPAMKKEGQGIFAPFQVADK